MSEEITLNYQLRDSDCIEAEQLKLINKASSWTNLLFIVVFFSYGLAAIQNISDYDFRLFEYLKQIWIDHEMPENHLVTALFYFSFATIDSCSTFPKYNPLYRWNLSRRYQKNFVKQELKYVVVGEDEINLKSCNYR